MDWDDINTCMSCGSNDLSAAEDGFLYCNVCASQSQHYQEQCFDEEQRGAFNRTHVREYNVARNEALASQVQNQLEAIFGAELEDAPFTTFLDDCGPGTVFGAQYPNFAHQVAYQYSKHLGSKFASYYLAAQIEAASKSSSQPAEDSQLSSQLAALAAPELRAQVERILFEKFSNSVRKTYIHGLQRILQMQCETLVERFQVTPLICGICGSLWTRFLASTDVFDKDWAQEAMEAAELAEKSKGDNNRRVKKAVQSDEEDSQGEEAAKTCSGAFCYDPLTMDRKKKKRKQAAALGVVEPRTSFNVKATDVWLRALKARVPVRTTLAILYLACYVAREPILPTDITDWAYEGSVPYLAAFTELDKPMVRDGVVVADPMQYPLDVKVMFQPNNVTGARNIECLAGHIAHRIGLQVPCVNYHGIFSRFLLQLGLPVDRLLLHGDRLYQWYAPTGLWLSACEEAFPTRVYVMAMLVVVLKIFYKLDGRKNLDQDMGREDNTQAFLECSVGMQTHGGLPRTAPSSTPGSQTSIRRVKKARTRAVTTGLRRDHEWPARPMLDRLEPLRRQVETFGFAKDLASYTKYCQEIIFPSQNLRWDEEKVLKRFQRIFEKPFKQIQGRGEYIGNVKGSVGKRRRVSSQGDLKPMESTATFCSRESRVEVNVGMTKSEKGYQKQSDQELVVQSGLDYPGQDDTGLAEAGLDMKEEDGSLGNSYDLADEMDTLGFECIAPVERVPCSDGYTRYNFMRSKTGHFGVHVEYFIVLHVCSNILKVHPQSLHKSVQNVEKGLRHLELGVEAFLSTWQALERNN